MRNVSTRLLTTALAFTIYLATGPGYVVAQLNCQRSSSVTTNGSITTSDPTQTGRIFRDGFPSLCLSGKTVSLSGSAVLHYKSYNFTAPVTGCATVEVNFAGCGSSVMYAAAYSAFNPASPAANVIGDAGASTSTTSTFDFPVTAGQNFTIVVHEVAANTGCANFSFTVSYNTGCRQVGFDVTNDGKADPTVFRPPTTDWFTLNSAGGVANQRFGLAGDILTSGDYTGDGSTDVSVYRQSNSTWYWAFDHMFRTSGFATVPFGIAGDIPVPGDYDQDGKTDIAIWRPSTGVYYIIRSTNNTLQTAQWGKNGDIPVIGDFDGDRIVDYAVARPSGDLAGQYAWWIWLSNFDRGVDNVVEGSWGLNSDKLVPADYDGDGVTDVAVWRPSNGTWYVTSVQTGAAFGAQWGANGDTPQPADYDGDKKADFAVVRQDATQALVWYIHNSSNNTASGVQWGAAGDVPATAAYPIQ